MGTLHLYFFLNISFFPEEGGSLHQQNTVEWEREMWEVCEMTLGVICAPLVLQVEVGNTSRWIVGVMAESAQRTGDFSAQKGRWFLWNNNGLYHARCTPLDPSEVKPEKMPTRIRVWLDFGAGEISFYDPENNVHLHTLKEPFYEKVFPYFNTLSALRIVPIKQPLWGQAPESEQD